MIEFDKYTSTVMAAYTVSLAVLAGLIVLTVLRNARARRDLEQQERRNG